MLLKINGEEKNIIDSVSSIEKLLDYLKVESKMIVVEKNREIIDKDTYSNTILVSGDEVELIRFMGGG